MTLCSGDFVSNVVTKQISGAAEKCAASRPSEKYFILAFALRKGLSTEFTESSYLGNTSKPKKLQRGRKNIKTKSERGNTSQATQSTDVGMLEKS